jgi:hypothetical protein
MPASDHPPDIVALERTSKPAVSIVDDHEIRELVLPPSAAGRQRSEPLSSMNMPPTAIALTIEFTRVGHDFWVPIFLAVAASAATLHACAGRGASRYASAGGLTHRASAVDRGSRSLAK